MVNQATLICNVCNNEKPLSEFRRDQHNTTGYATNCRSCFNASQKEYRLQNRESYNQNAVDYYHKNRDRINEMRRLRHQGKSTKHLHRTKTLSAYYLRTGWKKNKENTWAKRGIVDMTYDRFEEMLINQNHCCAICTKPQEIVGTLHVDHCHDTGVVRGLLCNNCNNGIGKLGDSVTILQQAIKYLQDATRN